MSTHRTKSITAVASGKLTAAKRWGSTAHIEELEGDLRTARIAEYAAKVVADAPPLTDDQLATIIAVIHPARGERA